MDALVALAPNATLAPSATLAPNTTLAPSATLATQEDAEDLVVSVVDVSTSSSALVDAAAGENTNSLHTEQCAGGAQSNATASDKGAAEAEPNVEDATQVLAATLAATASAPLPMPPVTSESVTGMGTLPRDALTHFLIVYRASSTPMTRGPNKEACFMNFLAAVMAFAKEHARMPIRLILAQNMHDAVFTKFARDTARTVLGHACRNVVIDAYAKEFDEDATSFRFAVDAALAMVSACPLDTTAVYVVDDACLHAKGALSVILGGLSLAPYATGYDHPDKYVDAARGGNLLVAGGGEVCRVLRGADRHWRTTNSTITTFVTTLRTLSEDAATLRMFADDAVHMFLALSNTRGRALVSPMPAVATHVHALAPFVDWERIGSKASEFLRIAST